MYITQAILGAEEASVPTIRSRYSPNLNPNLVSLISKKKILVKAFLSTKNPWYKTQLNRIKKQISKEIKRQTAASIDKICSNIKDNPVNLWRAVRKVVQNSSPTPTSPPLSTPNGPCLSPLEKANVFADQLENTFKPQDTPNENPDTRDCISENYGLIDENHPMGPMDHDNPGFDITVTKFCIATAVNSCKPTTPGTDLIRYLHLQKAPLPFLDKVAVLYNSSLNLGYLPCNWKESKIIMIPKPHKDHKQPGNYRPINLTSNLCKTLEKILAARLHTFLGPAIPDNQSGFRPGRSTDDGLYRLSAHLQDCADNPETFRSLVVSFDAEKAFDTVWHAGLISKLALLNTPAIVLRWIISFIKDRSAFVSVHNTQSRPFTPAAGVPQGAVLSPLLYILYTYDVPTPPPTSSRLSTLTTSWLGAPAGTGSRPVIGSNPSWTPSYPGPTNGGSN